MYQLHISDELYEKAARAAQASHVTVDDFVSSVLEHHLVEEGQQPSIRLSPDQINVVRESQAQIKAGKGLSIEQVEERLETDRTAWLKRNS